MKLSLCAVAIGMATLSSACTSHNRPRPRADPADDSLDPYALPDAPAPPTLPDLTHRALAGSMESGFASIRGNTQPDGSNPGRYFGWTERLEAEQAVSIRRWYVGLSEQLALGKAKDGNFLMVAGNPEVWGRALWASQAGLAYGGGWASCYPPFTTAPKEPTLRKPSARFVPGTTSTSSMTTSSSALSSTCATSTAR